MNTIKEDIYRLGFWVYFVSLFVCNAKWPSSCFITGDTRRVTKHLNLRACVEHIQFLQ